MAARASVIIPAHDEEASLAAGLRTLLRDVPAGEVEAVVVANGCRDRTVDVARTAAAEVATDVTVLDLPTASKTVALNAGDDVATAFPRVYLDADVACAPATLESLVAALSDGRTELAVPTRHLDTAAASWWVRQYYRAWEVLPRVRAELSGRGAYAFSRAGRQRFERFPALTADDYWAVRQVPAERAVVVPEEIVIRPPLDVRALVRVRSRIYRANRAANVRSTGRSSMGADLAFLARAPRRWLSGIVFVATNAYIKLIGVRRQQGYGRDAARGAGSSASSGTQDPTEHGLAGPGR